MTKLRRFAWSGTSAAVVIAAAAALLPLAWLQYRWIGQVSEFEGERARAQVRTAALTFAQSFDERIRQPLAAVTNERPGPPARTLEEELRRGLARWEEAAVEPGLVRGAYLAGLTPEDRLDLRRYEPGTGNFEPISWPGQLESLRSEVSRWGGSREGAAMPFMDEVVPAIALPLALRRQRAEGPEPPGVRRRPPALPRASSQWLILEFDLDAIRRDLLARLFERVFPSNAEPRFEVMIRGRYHPEAILYRSDPRLEPAFFAAPDARAALFEMRREPPRREGPGLPGPAGPGWELLVKNRAGPLEAVVDRTRRRNLAVSAAILLVLAASIGILVVSARRAQRLANLQIEFVAGVSHELKTPLAVICSAGENLADGVVTADSQARRYGEVIRGEGRRLSRMVEEILAFAGIQRNRMKFEAEPVEVQPLIARAAALCEAEHPGSSERIEFEAAPGLPLLLADPTSLTHCLRNLLQNAIVHSGGKGPVIVRARPLDGRVEVQVEDRGVGIEPEDLPHIFDAFYRGRRATEEQVHGFGLGLTLVKHVVEAHGGTVSVVSRPGEGTCFTLRIPGVPAPEA